MEGTLIPLHELKKLANKEKVGVGILEKDYAITNFLYGLSKIKEKEFFVFKGGTAIRKTYFPEWRYSEDLDFTVTKKHSKEELKKILEKIFSFILKSSGIKFNLRSLHINPGYAMLRLQFIALLKSKNTIKLDLSFNEPIFSVKERNVIWDYSDRKRCRVFVYSLEEILAEKLRSIIERGKSRDYYDVWRILKFYFDRLDIKLVNKIFVNKCRFKKLEFSFEKLFSSEKISVVKGYWSNGLAYQVRELPKFEVVINDLKELVKKINLD